MAASSPHLYVASDEASFTNAVDLVVDGGQTEL
jgi:hypothetical protein